MSRIDSVLFSVTSVIGTRSLHLLLTAVSARSFRNFIRIDTTDTRTDAFAPLQLVSLASRDLDLRKIPPPHLSHCNLRTSGV